MEQIEGLFVMLTSKDAVAACAAADQLVKISADSDAVYPYFDRIAALLTHKNSLVRNRALALLAANAQWDEENRFNTVIDAYLQHIADEKPITARQCLKYLPEITAAKPALSGRIAEALRAADPSKYADSMRPLVARDIAEALRRIAAESPSAI